MADTVPEPSDSMSRADLIALCKQRNLTGYSGKRKSEILEMLAPKQPALKVLSLFSGCGGLDSGFHAHRGFAVVRAYDAMKQAVDTYNLNFNPPAEVFDVLNVMDQDFDLGFAPDVIIGGPPCQDFSAAGKQTLGARANLTEVFANIVVKYQPKYFVMENVPAILTTGKTVYDKVVKKFTDAAYGLTVRVVRMPDYGVPQERKRLIIIGVKNAAADAMAPALDGSKDPVRSIRDYTTKTNDDLGLGGLEHIYRHPRSYARRGVFSIDELYPTVRGCLRKMPPNYAFHAGDTAQTRDEVLSPDWRFVSRVQTFPADFKFANSRNALIIGNAVPPKFSGVLAKIIAEHHAPT